MKKIIVSIFFLSFTTWTAKGQNEMKPINTGAANFLTIAPDAQGAATGGAGVAVTGRDHTIFYNAAGALLDNTRKGGVTATFAPWMRGQESGHSLNSLAGFYKIDNKNALLASVRYYHYPKIEEITGGEITGKIHPKELAIDIGYARELFQNFAVSATFRYVYSNMGNIGEAKNASAVAFDIGALYKQAFSMMPEGSWALGLTVSNIGSKIKYLDTKEDLPAVAKLGGSVDLPFSNNHRIMLVADFGYRFLPSDIKAANVSAGLEYTLMQHLMFRGGYHYGDTDKGDNSYGTAGLGINYLGGHVDFTWLFAQNDSPLKNSFWVSLGFSF
ncbi:MAG: PorV/PorQ family protein [Bacteroides sp.]|nr:PorV/PorQ family protein [Bacteroides sp.]